MAHIRRHPKSGSWQVRYRGPDGRERSKTFARKVDADAFAATVTADVLRGDYIDPKAGKVTVAEMAERWQATRSHLAVSTLARDASLLRSLILPTFGDRSVSSLKPSEIAAWASSLDRAPFTVGRAIRVLFAVLELARRDGAMRVNPAADVKPPRQVAQRSGKSLTDAEIRRIIDAAQEEAPDTAAMVVVMATMGLRIGEAIALKREDVDPASGALRVCRSRSRAEGDRPVKGRTSSDEGRVLPLSVEAASALSLHLDRTLVNMDGYLFTGPRGGVIRDTNWRRRVWSRIVARAGVDALPHDLRHTVATRLFVVDRWTPAEVQAFLGHRDPRVTLKIYTHVKPAELPRPSALADTSRTPPAAEAG